MTSFIGLIIGLKIAFWALVVVLLIWFAPEIGDALNGLADRFDHLIGYSESVR